jgi:type IV fimbrial biogenesis protein FimT
LSAYPKFRQSGFSLVEMMAGIVVLSVLVALALPSFQTMLQNSQIRNAAESVLNGIQRARAEAVKQNRNIEFVLSGDDATCFDAGTLISTTCSSWTVQWVNGGGNPIDNANPIASAKSREGSQNVKRVVLPAGAHTITFNNVGSMEILNNDGSPAVTVISFNSTILSPADSHEMKVMISAGGAAKMCDPKLAHNTPRGC